MVLLWCLKQTISGQGTEKLPQRHGAAFSWIFIHFTRSFPNNEFRKFLADSQQAPNWMFLLGFSVHHRHFTQLPSVQMCLINNGWVPTEYVAPDCRMKQLSVRALEVVRPPKGEEKWQVYNSSFSRGNWTLFLLGGCPTLAPWEDLTGLKSQGSMFA